MLKGVMYSLLTVLMIFLFENCKKESDLYPEDVTINFKIYDDNQILITGAKVYLFDNEQSYTTALATNNPVSYSIDSAISSITAITFKLKAETNYWILVSYNDVTRTLTLSNSGISSQLDKFAKGSIVNSNISIGPSNANVSFWTAAGNQVPISIHFNGQIIDLTNNSLTAAPLAPGDPGALNFQVPPGIYPYYAVGLNNCVWTGSLNVQAGTFTPVQLNQCDRGVVSFYTPVASSANTYPISVVLNNLDNAGSVAGAYPSFVCGDPANANVLTVFREPGTYTYVAKSNDGRCTWTNTFTISANSCTVIQLPFCP
jgi:hypothetical protein